MLFESFIKTFDLQIVFIVLIYIRRRLYLLGQEPDWRLMVSACVQKYSQELVDQIYPLYLVDQGRIQNRYFGPKIVRWYHFKLGLFVSII